MKNTTVHSLDDFLTDVEAQAGARRDHSSRILSAKPKLANPFEIGRVNWMLRFARNCNYCTSCTRLDPLIYIYLGSSLPIFNTVVKYIH